MNKIIAKTLNGEATMPVTSVGLDLYYSGIFVIDPYNLLTLRNYMNVVTRNVGESFYHFYEVGYFLEMLLEGEVLAFEVLHTEGLNVIGKTLEFDMIYNKRELFTSMNIIEKLTREGADLFKTVRKGRFFKLNENKIKKTIELFGYDVKKAYLCIKKLMLAKIILEKGFYDIKNINWKILQRILDGEFDFKGIKRLYISLIKTIYGLKKVSNIPDEANIEEVNELLMDIRNIKIIDLNTE